MAADGLASPTPDAIPPEVPVAADDQEEASPERVITLSDAVVAISLTLLILGIQVPAPGGLRNPDSTSQLASALSQTVNGWISYGVSFYVIAQFWLLHRQAFRGVRVYREGLAGLNFLFLFTISVMPFTSDLISKYPNNSLSVMIFSANLILANLATYRMQWFSRRHGLLTPQGIAALERHRPLDVNLFFYVLAIPVALVSPGLGKLCWLGIVVAPRISSLITKRRQAS
jgi:uncharacterized membrane protein